MEKTANEVLEQRIEEWRAYLRRRQAIYAVDVDELARYRQAPGMPYAHPTVEHFTPVFVALGAATDPSRSPKTTITGNFYGLSKRSFEVA